MRCSLRLCAGIVLAAGGLFAAEVPNAPVTSSAIYVPDLTHAGEPLPDGVLAWNSLVQTTNVPNGQESVQFAFSFTNVSAAAGSAAPTNAAGIANHTPGSVAILDAQPSCGCTQPQLPPTPWIIPPGGTGEFTATVNLEGNEGTMIKSITLKTDKGYKDLYMRITVLPPVMPTLTDAQRAHDLQIAKADRQAVFKGDCIKCHVQPGNGKYGRTLYETVCGICHDGEHRAEFVPDLHDLKTPTNLQFWQTWISRGKPGTLMPAFATAEGGPLTDMQISTLAAYLNAIIPSHPAQTTTNAPAN
ncbi:MAG TPA: DUF1573 domain-containing protein [Verrucomicrobiae bacterium]|nr:DUF1573 domain-containing protein [Verrucomicrobiae bacterium]